MWRVITVDFFQKILPSLQICMYLMEAEEMGKEVAWLNNNGY